MKIGYLAPFVFQTIIMAMTAYKAWSFSREQQPVPIMRRLLRDEMKYYSGFAALLVLIEVGSMIRGTKAATTGSLLFTATLSVMCGRIILHGFSLNRRTNVCTTYLEVIELGSLRVRPPSSLDGPIVGVQSGKPPGVEELAAQR
ncbi:hypothetical protein FRC06_006611 [Ceratobasidium sp. 370]|nr:hypothetical protein FRC06_006611 [Ceratobasidium sp. 370]